MTFLRFRPTFRIFVFVLCILYIVMLVAFQSGLDFRRDLYNSKGSGLSRKSTELQERDQLLENSRHDQISGSPPCAGPKADLEFEFKEVINNLFLFSAYWDTRHNDFDNRNNRTYVRIMAILLSTQRIGKDVSNCVFQVEGISHLSPLNYYEMCENHNRKYGGFILSCLVPKEVEHRPCSVEVQSSDGSSLRTVRVPVYSLQRRKKTYRFGLCLSPLFGTVSRVKFIEFMELSAMLGAQRITLYNSGQDSGLNLVLDYYVRTGMLDIVPWKLPTVAGAKMWYHGQLVAIQDCLYRNMATADFLAFNDLDEFIMPRELFDWEDMIRAVHRPDHCGYTFKSAFFDPRQTSTYSGEGHFLFTAIGNQRTKTYSKFRTKNMVIPQRIFEKGIHHISKPILANLQVPLIDPKVAFLHHYRSCMPGYGMNCNQFKTDNHIIETYHELPRKVKKVCKKTGIRCR